MTRIIRIATDAAIHVLSCMGGHVDRMLERLGALPRAEQQDLIEAILREAGLEVYDPNLEADPDAGLRDIIFVDTEGDYLSLDVILEEFDAFGVYDVVEATAHPDGGLDLGTAAYLLPVETPESAQNARSLMWTASDGKLLVFGGVREGTLHLFIS